MVGLPAAQRAQLQQGLNQALAAGGGEAGRQNALMLFLRTLFRPDEIDAAQQQLQQQRVPPAPGAEGVLNEEGDSEEEAEEFEQIPEEWRREWQHARGAADADADAAAAQQDWDAPD